MRHRVETNEALALIEGRGRGRLAVDGSRPAEVIAAWMNELGAGAVESGRAAGGIDVLFYVLSGQARAVVAGRKCALAAGDSFAVLADETYSVGNAGDAELRLLEMQLPCQPVGLAAYPDTCSDQGSARRNEE